MKNNSYAVIVYKILGYLLGCLKAGKIPRCSLYTPGSMLIGEIPIQYWNEVMAELTRLGYIKNALIENSRNGFPHVDPGLSVTVTLKGVEYLYSNSMMAEARKEMSEADLLIEKAVATS